MKITVFCASSEQIDEDFFQMGRALGGRIGREGWELIYGGTNCGLMREVANATLAEGGKVTGIIPGCIAGKGVAAQNLTELRVVEDMKERKQQMRDQADAFLALPGGWGTLEEITEVITLKQLGIHRKPVVFLNINGFYDVFFTFIRQASVSGFISPVYEKLYRLTSGIEDTVAYLKSYQPPEFCSKYENKEIF